MTATLYMIACAAPPARRIAVGIRAAQAAGWDVCLVLTPAAWDSFVTAVRDGEFGPTPTA